MDPPDRIGAVGVSCAADRVRLAWARSDPTSKKLVSAVHDAVIPDDPPRHRVSLAACDASGCSVKEATIVGMTTGYSSLGGWSSPMALDTPEVVPLETALVVFWSSGAAVSYRVAPLEGREAAATRDLVDVVRDEEAKKPDPRAVSWNAFRGYVVRGDAMLLLLEDMFPVTSILVVRFDASGAARPIVAP